MTRDAKIGLLLGLVFIFIIAFIINGLPSLGRDDGNELTRNMARPQRNKPGIGTDARQVTQQKTVTPVKPVNPSTQSQPQAAETQTNQVRYEAQLPQSPTTIVSLPSEQSAPAQVSNPQTILIPAQQQSQTAIGSRPQPARTILYTVKDGDNLASIAKQFYGEELGNKKVNVDKIFAANRKLLKSADQIYVGQKLIVPPLTETASTKPENVLPAESFKPVASIGTRHQQQTIKLTDKTRYYIVKEGDNLWKIASEQLGDGNRYPELAKLNRLEDEDFLVVGAHLKLP